jgi:hypothetical protein
MVREPQTTASQSPYADCLKSVVRRRIAELDAIQPEPPAQTSLDFKLAS